MKEISIYTDGACSGNPGPGGYGAILMYRGTERVLSGYEAVTTNQRMELMAAIKALSAIKEPCRVKLYSDSAYLINAFEKDWFKGWLTRGWRNSQGNAVANQDLWEELLRLSKVHKIEWIKVKGHSDNEYNNRCDELARMAIKDKVGLEV